MCCSAGCTVYMLHLDLVSAEKNRMTTCTLLLLLQIREMKDNGSSQSSDSSPAHKVGYEAVGEEPLTKLFRHLNRVLEQKFKEGMKRKSVIPLVMQKYSTISILLKLLQRVWILYCFGRARHGGAGSSSDGGSDGGVGSS